MNIDTPPALALALEQMSESTTTSRSERALLALLVAFTAAAVAGFAIYAMHPERVGRVPGGAAAYGLAMALFPRGHIVLGHGSHPYPGDAENADQLVTFSGPWSDYRWSQAHGATYHAYRVVAGIGVAIGR